MKLTCDLCGGELQMNLDGQGAACAKCGMTYSMEHLRKKLGMESGGPEIPDIQEIKDKTVTSHHLYIKRRMDMIVLCKVAVVLDGQQIGILAGLGKTTAIPVSQGTHRISFRAADGSGITEMKEMTFHVGRHDWYGEFWLHRGAFKAEYRFEMRECL